MTQKPEVWDVTNSGDPYIPEMIRQAKEVLLPPENAADRATMQLMKGYEKADPITRATRLAGTEH